jgi:hypothetical protein
VFLELARRIDLVVVLGPCLLHIHIVDRVLADLKSPVGFVWGLASAEVIFDPPDKAFEAADQCIANPHASTVSR